APGVGASDSVLGIVRRSGCHMPSPSPQPLSPATGERGWGEGTTRAALPIANRSRLCEIAEKFQTVTGDMETLLAQRGHQIRVELLRQLWVERRVEILDLPGFQAAEVVVGLTAAIIASRPFRVGQLGGQTGVHQGF